MNARIDPELLPIDAARPILPPRPRPAPPPRGPETAGTGGPAPRLGEILVGTGELDPGDLLRAVAMQGRQASRLGEILVAQRMVSADGLCRALAQQYDCGIADLDRTPPDVRLIDAIGADRCLRHGFVPLYRVGDATVCATGRPDHFQRLAAVLPPALGRPMMQVAPDEQIRAALTETRHRALSRTAESRVDADSSCRDWHMPTARRVAMILAAGLAIGALLAPQGLIVVLTLLASLTMVVNGGLRLAALVAMLRPRAALSFHSRRTRKPMAMLPVVSILVPLFREREIAGRLIRRLMRLDYPQELLDICLVAEADDAATIAAVREAGLPQWIQLVTVPEGTLKTKPRAMNYALDFCRGSIIGIYDAEDAPAPDQIHRIVRQFHDSPPDVACLQGMLDFYNSEHNWLARCFTLEYATWFRLVLPGLQRLGFAIPLGGTSVFIRREVLEDIGRWDAHNVTEDADLGIRLARRGYRTMLVPTVTEEEANARLWPWVRQRSRWIKGYAITWAVHMRDPRRLWRELGARRFIGVQLLFLGTLAQFALGPFLLPLWAVGLGLLPAETYGPGAAPMLMGLLVLSLTAEALNMTVGIIASRRAGRRWLWLWLPTMHLYFALGTLAALKGFWELLARPFFWDKTAHGLSPRRARRRAARLPAADTGDVLPG